MKFVDALCHVSTPLPYWKRAINLTCCAIALPGLAVTSVFVGLIMKSMSPGPIFFTQERVGYMGRRFKLYKFRTMHVSASSSAHEAHLGQLIGTNTPMHKLDARGDSRLIPAAWLVRASGLDELPQVINVLRGEMSIVGPRPCVPYEFDRYTVEQRARCASVPGLTGLWQVSGKNRTTFEKMVELDVRYGTDRSLMTDIVIILRTIPTLCHQILDTQKARRSLTVPNRLSPAAGVETPCGSTPP